MQRQDSSLSRANASRMFWMLDTPILEALRQSPQSTSISCLCQAYQDCLTSTFDLIQLMIGKHAHIKSLKWRLPILLWNWCRWSYLVHHPQFTSWQCFSTIWWFTVSTNTITLSNSMSSQKKPWTTCIPNYEWNVKPRDPEYEASAFCWLRCLLTRFNALF